MYGTRDITDEKMQPNYLWVSLSLLGLLGKKESNVIAIHSFTPNQYWVMKL